MLFSNAAWHGLIRDASRTCVESSELALPPDVFCLPRMRARSMQSSGSPRQLRVARHFFLLVVAVTVAVVGPHVLLVGDCWPAMLVKSKRTLQDQQLSARRGREAVQLALQKQGAYSLQSFFACRHV